MLSKLDYLDIGFNILLSLPDELSSLHSLKTLRCMNNLLEIVPSTICDMDLRVLDVSSNPLLQPPLETCERGIESMRRYYHALKLEEQMAGTGPNKESMPTNNKSIFKIGLKHERSRNKMRKKKDSVKKMRLLEMKMVVMISAKRIVQKMKTKRILVCSLP